MAGETKYSLPRVMTVKRFVGVSACASIDSLQLLRRGELPAFRIGTDWRFNAEVIDRWCLERNTKTSDGGTSSQN
jgi:hypothetical protein